LPDWIVSRSLRLYLLGGYLVLIIALVVSGIIANRSNRSARTDFRHTVETVDAISSTILTSIKLHDDEETALRGYLLTGQPVYLAPYASAAKALPLLQAQVDTLASAR
jgi:methyl-accepting chemotaxis protein